MSMDSATDRPGAAAWHADRLWRLLPVAASLVASVIFIARSSFLIDGERYFSLFDDAMVSMTYARNLAHGNGLVWMVGGESVEGYSNFLWTLWMAVLHLLGVPESKVSLLVMSSSAAILAINVEVVGRLADELASGDRRVGLAARVLAAASYSLAYWSLRGMEVGLVALVVGALTLGSLRFARAPSRGLLGQLAVVLAVGLTLRPDTPVLCGLCVAFLVLRAPPAWRLKAAAMLCGTGALALGAHFVFRRAQYGDWLPNTYTLKMVGVPLAFRVSRGASVLWEAVTSYLWPVLGVAAVGWRPSAGSSGARGFLAGLVAAALGYSVWVGGDSWEQAGFANRFVCGAADPLLGLVALGVVRLGDVLLNQRLWERWPAPTTVALALGLAWASDRANYVKWLEGSHFEWHEDCQAVAFGRILAKSTPAETTVAVAWAGAIPYFSHRFSIDLLGKSDKHVASSPPHPAASFWPGHNKWDYDYSINQLRPIVVQALWTPDASDFQRMAVLGYQALPNGMWFDSRFAQRLDLAGLARRPDQLLGAER